ncbi:hypothetical protein G6F68_009798 [Rhizopus microsporus]|nr:hypothetical protein G6F68_009798 [Rhizopus microsporus]
MKCTAARVIVALSSTRTTSFSTSAVASRAGGIGVPAGSDLGNQATTTGAQRGAQRFGDHPTARSILPPAHVPLPGEQSGHPPAAFPHPLWNDAESTSPSLEGMVMGNGMRGFGLVGLALLAGCGQAPPTALGTLEWDRVTVPAPAAEVIAAVEVREGQQVKAGQLLYQVDPAPYQAAFDTARGQLAQAEASVLSAQPKAERTRALVSMDAASKQDADDATSALKQAQANVIAARAALQAARINLDYTRVTAPIDGRIGTSSVTAGALVAAGQDAALTTIQRLDPVYLDVTQSSTQMLALRKQLDAGLVKAIDGKAQVQVVLEDGSTYAHEGTLEFVGSAVDPGTGNVVLRAVIPNPDGLLLPGMYVRVQTRQGVDPEAILVPQRAVLRSTAGKPQVMVVGKDEIVESRLVQTGTKRGGDWHIVEGLNAGDRVIGGGVNAAVPGQKVSVTPAAEPKVAAAGKASASAAN